MKKIVKYSLYFSILFGIGTGCLAIYLYLKGSQFENLSNLGEFVGGIAGSLWALSGVILFYQALKDQQISLEATRKGLELQIQEMLQANAIFKEQSQQLKLQGFEGRFFNSINLLNTQSSYLIFSNNGKNLKGLRCFQHIFENLNQRFKKSDEAIYSAHLSRESNFSSQDLKIFYNYLVRVFEEESRKNHFLINHYLASVKNIILLITNNGLNKKDEKYYLKLFSSQFSTFELGILFYYFLSPANKGYKKYLDKNLFFSHIEERALLFPEIHINFYPETSNKWIDISE